MGRPGSPGRHGGRVPLVRPRGRDSAGHEGAFLTEHRTPLFSYSKWRPCHLETKVQEEAASPWAKSRRGHWVGGQAVGA